MRLALIFLVGCGFKGNGEMPADAAVDDMGHLLVDAAIDAPSMIDMAVNGMDMPPPMIDAPPDTPSNPNLTCPAMYGPLNGVGMYRPVEPGNLGWAAAAADCNDDDDGGTFTGHTHLVVIRDEAERMVLTTGTSPVTGNTWIGLSDLAAEGTFVWVTSENTNGYPMLGMRPPWDANEPDDAGGNEDCGRFKNGFSFEDKPCDGAMSYVCECDMFAPN